MPIRAHSITLLKWLLYKQLGMGQSSNATSKKCDIKGPHVKFNHALDMVSIFNNAKDRCQDKTAFYCLGCQLSFHDLDFYSTRLAYYFVSQGLKPNDKVALMMPNLLQYPIVLLAILKCKMVVVNINPLEKANIILHQLKDSGAKMMVVLENCTKELDFVVDQSKIQQVILTRVSDFHPPIKRVLLNSYIRYIKRAVPKVNLTGPYLSHILKSELAPQSLPKTIDANDIAFIQYTGGTTGLPKGVVLTHGSVSANIYQVMHWAGDLFDADDLMASPLPFYHVFSLVVNCFLPLGLGVSNLLIPNPRDTKRFIKDLASHPVTAITGVNTLYHDLMAHPLFESINWGRLKLSVGGGMACDIQVAKAWQKSTGCVLTQGYGLTEASPVVCVNDHQCHDFSGTIGYPIANTILCLKDRDGQRVRNGEPGELCVKGPQVMKGYWRKPKATLDSIDQEGFLHTGDVALFTENGQVKIIDRMKDMVIVSGFKVYPREVEVILNDIKGVFECAVIGVADDKTGEALKAFVVREKKSKLESNDIIEYCRTHLTGYKVPHQIEFCHEIPKSNVGKILKKDLRD